MKVTLEWTEERLLRSQVTVDDTAILEWLNDPVMNGGSDTVKSLSSVTASDVKDFLESGDDDVWLDQAQDRPYVVAVEDVVIDDVTL